MLNKLPPDHMCVFPKKDARIHWTFNENFEVNEYKVYQICNQNRAEALNERLKEMKIINFSSGNCFSDWDEWTLEDCLLEIFKYMIADKNVLKQIFIQLGKIEEFSIRLSYFNNNYWNVR